MGHGQLQTTGSAAQATARRTRSGGRRRRVRLWTARLMMAGTLLLLTAGVVLANSSTYAWTMYYRVVDGTKTGTYHGLDAGAMTNSGSATAFSKDAGAYSAPLPISVEVWKDDFVDSKVCSVQRTISSVLNVYRTYSISCGSVSAGVYYLVIWKSQDDGWNMKGSGTLKTQ